MIQAAAKQRENSYRTMVRETVGMEHTRIESRTPPNASSLGRNPSPPNLQRTTNTRRPGAYRIRRNSVVSVRQDDADEEMQQQLADEDEDEGTARTMSNSSTEQHDVEEADEDHHQQNVTLEAELVPPQSDSAEDDEVVVKAEPIRGCRFKFFLTLLVFLLASLLLFAGIFLVPRIQSQQQKKQSSFVGRTTFPYYTHHSVLFGAHDASLQDVRVTLSCGNGAVATKDVNGPCDDQADGEIDCALGNVVGDYNRHIFFSCGSDSMESSPVTSVRAEAESGQGLWFFYLFQLCQEEATLPRNIVCSGQEHYFDDGMSVCYASTSLRIESTGVSCPSSTPFVPSPNQAKDADLREDTIVAWFLEGSDE